MSWELLFESLVSVIDEREARSNSGIRIERFPKSLSGSFRIPIGNKHQLPGGFAELRSCLKVNFKKC